MIPGCGRLSKRRAAVHGAAAFMMLTASCVRLKQGWACSPKKNESRLPVKAEHYPDEPDHDGEELQVTTTNQTLSVSKDSLLIPKTMKAAVMQKPLEVTIEELPVPAPGAGEVL